jgi:hypothetical protein
MSLGARIIVAAIGAKLPTSGSEAALASACSRRSARRGRKQNHAMNEV